VLVVEVADDEPPDDWAWTVEEVVVVGAAVVVVDFGFAVVVVVCAGAVVVVVRPGVVVAVGAEVVVDSAGVVDDVVDEVVDELVDDEVGDVVVDAPAAGWRFSSSGVAVNSGVGFTPSSAVFITSEKMRAGNVPPVTAFTPRMFVIGCGSGKPTHTPVASSGV
jgi:hypothetical protein